MRDFVLGHIKGAYKGYGKDSHRLKDMAIHVSDLYGLCPRAYFLCHTYKRPFHTFMPINLALGWTFDMGVKIQDILVERLAKQGILWGTWECQHCVEKDGKKHRQVHLYDPNARCNRCNSPALTYVDTTLVAKFGAITVVGNVDTFLMRDAAIFSNECKSIKEADFITLNAPLVKHVYQVNGYIWLLRKKETQIKHKKEKIQVYQNTATITYCVKGNSIEPFKVFDIGADDDIIAGYDRKIAEINAALKGGKVPCRICKTEASLMARACTARVACFEGGIGSWDKRK